MADTKIEWTDRTINPIRARNKKTGRVGWWCSHASDGCKHCYAEAMNLWVGNGVGYLAQRADEVEIFLDEKMLLEPLTWRVPQKVFPCDMTDLFGEFVSDDLVDQVMAMMAMADWHTWQVLTKRSARMRTYFEDPLRKRRIAEAVGLLSEMLARQGRPMLKLDHFDRVFQRGSRAPFRNIWFGVSVEDQKNLRRLNDLAETPATLRWASFEPLLEDLGDIGPWLQRMSPDSNTRRALDWGVIGGESGSRAREHHLDWDRSIIRQFRNAGPPIFEKQLGKKPVQGGQTDTAVKTHLPIAHKKGGDPEEWPEDLRVREFPA